MQRMTETILLIIWLFIIVTVLTGCTTIKYNPETTEFSYSSPPWGKKIGQVEVLREADGSILFTMSDYQTENVSAIAGAVAEGVVRGIK